MRGERNKPQPLYQNQWYNADKLRRNTDDELRRLGTGTLSGLFIFRLRNFSTRYVAAVPTLKSDSMDLEQNVVVSSSE
ncbi:hypothetical protein MTR_7g045010 [Medicago truncatula]|uniref:Uncharacterized protein n=1 Tax=Medicago truncatula TaxID=3880 RepID=G7KTY3_MEDTR|nr:hypothetical protein MTR_7g045010 [Medicago truncatula]